MISRKGIAIWEALVVFIVAPSAMVSVGSLAMLGPLKRAQEMTNRAVCMSNLSSINKALVLYRASNEDVWPWLGDLTSDPSAVTTGTNRNRRPPENRGKPDKRSVTSLMFLLVRDYQTPAVFRCPSDRNAMVDDAPKAGEDDGDVKEGEYYWDFSSPRNVSFSWQAPIHNGAKKPKAVRYLQGIDGAELDSVVVADMTPAAVDPNWKPADLSKIQDPIARSENSLNHYREQINVLYVAGNVKGVKRPDVGTRLNRSNIVIRRDNIYTASNDAKAGSQSATSLDIKKHLSGKDTFLIGPVGR